MQLENLIIIVNTISSYIPQFCGLTLVEGGKGMMKLLMSCEGSSVKVEVNQLKFEQEGAGHVLQILVPADDDPNNELSENIKQALVDDGMGIMTDGKPNTRGFTEIRILQGLEIDVYRSFTSVEGMSVDRVG